MIGFAEHSEVSRGKHRVRRELDFSLIQTLLSWNQCPYASMV